MAAQSLIEQHIIFLTAGSFDITSIMNNATIQTFASNSAGGNIIIDMRSFYNWNGTIWKQTIFYELLLFIPQTYQATVQSNMSALQTAFPQYTIVTWGGNTSFGN